MKPLNSQQVRLESFAEADERLCRPDVGRELVPHHRGAKTEKSCAFDDRLFLALSDGGTRRDRCCVQ